MRRLFRNPKQLLALAVAVGLAGLALLAHPDAPRQLLVVVALQLVTVAICWILYRRTRTALRAAEDSLRAGQAEALRQTQALMAVHSLVRLRSPLPEMGGWAISPDFAAFLVAQVRARMPRLAVETGSGVSTILIGYLLQEVGCGRLISLEHDERYAAETRENVALHGLSDVVEVVHAPLKPVEIKGETWLWYDLGCVPEPAEPVDFLLVDGPPQATQRMARYPALPLLASRLAADVCILMDDAARPDERGIAERWAAELPGASLRFLPHQRGTAFLRRAGKGPAF